MTEDSDDTNPSVDEELRTTRLHASRTNCPPTARRLADRLQGVDGVVEASLQPRSDVVVVTYDPARTSASRWALQEPTRPSKRRTSR